MSYTQHQTNPTHVAAGYKSTLTNPRTSEAAKSHARDMLNTMGVGIRDTSVAAPMQPAEPIIRTGIHSSRVLGGYKAALKNPNVSPEAKAQAREILARHGKL